MNKNYLLFSWAFGKQQGGGHDFRGTIALDSLEKVKDHLLYQTKTEIKKPKDRTYFQIVESDTGKIVFDIWK